MEPAACVFARTDGLSGACGQADCVGSAAVRRIFLWGAANNQRLVAQPAAPALGVAGWVCCGACCRSGGGGAVTAGGLLPGCVLVLPFGHSA